jgi:malate synthase
VVDAALIKRCFTEELASIKAQIGEEAYARGHVERAATLMQTMMLADELADFLTLPAYDSLVAEVEAAA